MNARNYLENIRLAEKRIQHKQELLQYYAEQATRATTTLRFDRVSGGSTQSRVELFALKRAELERELIDERAALDDCRSTVEAAAVLLHDERMRELLELRYLDGLTWEAVAATMQYDRSHVFRLNARLLEAFDESLLLGA